MITHVGIVGSEGLYWTKCQRDLATLKITEILGEYTTPILVSGGCHKGGIDIWAEDVARTLKINKYIFKPQVFQWSSINTLDGKTLQGYKDRNIKIAEKSDIVYSIEPEYIDGITPWKNPVAFDWASNKFYRKSGGMWTMRYTRNVLRKEGKLVIIPREDETDD